MDPAEYAKLAAVEDKMWYFRALHAHAENALLAHLSSREPKALLDAGCGTGGLIRRLTTSHPSWRWTGIDVSPIACGLARQRVASGVRVLEGSVTQLPFPEASFEGVTSLDVIYHVDDDVMALREFARVLRPGGVLVLNVPAYPWLWSYHDVATHARRRYSRDDLRRKLQSAGLVDFSITPWNTLFFPLIAARRKLLPAPRDQSDVRLSPPFIERMFDLGMAVERGWLRVMKRLPFGSSFFAVARRPDQQ